MLKVNAVTKKYGKVLANDGNFMIVETHEVAIFTVCRKKIGILVVDLLQEIGAFQGFGKPRRRIRKPTSVIIIERCQETALVGLFTEIPMHIPKGFGHPGSFVVFSLHDLHIGGVLTGFHQLTDTLSCRLPSDNLCSLGVAGASAFCKVNAVLGVPCGKLAVVGFETGTAIELFFENGGDLFHAFLLLERSNHNTSCIAFVASRAEHMVDIFLCKGKSEGCRAYTLRFIDKGHLLLFRGERGQIKQA